MGLDLKKAVGQFFVAGFRGTQLTPDHLKMASRLQLGGFILFKQNYENLEQLVALNRSIQDAMISSSPEALPAWICTDHEGGRVQRFGSPFTHFPPAQVWGKLNSPKTAFEAGYVMGSELKAAGVRINFFPVVDVVAQENVPGIGDRSFSSDPEVVANVGSAAVRGLQKAGVVGVPKHFPGHGSANVDSHVDLPVCGKTLEEVEQVDWIPFRRVIRARAEGIMTAHMLFPQLDPDRPATLSRKILQDQLRKNLRFSKLIFSDDLDMGAIRNKHSLQEAAFLAIEAGCDHLLICHSWDELEETWEYIYRAFESGALPLKKIEESWARVLDAKRRFLLPHEMPTFENARRVIGQEAYLEVARALEEGRVLEKGPSATEGTPS